MKNFSRYSSKDYKLLNPSAYSTDFGLDENDVIEFHLYSLSNTSILSINNLLRLFWRQIKPVETGLHSIEIDIKKILLESKITRGEFKFVINFLRNIVGNNLSNKLYVSQVVGNEVEIRSRKNIDLTFLSTFLNNNLKDCILNFGNNKLFQIVNIEIRNEKSILLKLYENISNDISKNEECWICYEVSYPVKNKVLILDEEKEKEEKIILFPNFDINVNENISIATDLKNWNTLLGTKLSVLDQILERQFNDIELNVQYNKFENFIHFSSAKERVVNFKYKLQQLEQYESEIYSLTSISGSIVPYNIIETYSKRNEVLSSFDGFEKFLYYTISGSLYTHVTGSYNPWPKNATQGKRQWEQKLETWNDVYAIPSFDNTTLVISASLTNTLYSVTSSEGVAYYTDLYDTAVLYDENNIHSLINYIPDFIKIDNENESFLLFMNMIGQHFDTIWLYIKELQNIFSIEDHPKDGTPLHLLPYLGEMLGWKLESNSNTKELYDYILGTDSVGNPKKWNNTLEAKNKFDLAGEVWKRIINNLPLILKSKGTKKSVQALLSCYGIPPTILKIKEFGKSSIDDTTKPRFEDESFKYALNLSSSANSYIKLPWGELQQTNEYPKAIELRIKLNTDYTYPNSYEETILEIT